MGPKRNASNSPVIDPDGNHRPRRAINISDDEEEHPLPDGEKEISYDEARDIVNAHIYDETQHGEFPATSPQPIATNTDTGITIFRARRNGEDVVVKRFDIGILRDDDTSHSREMRLEIVRSKHECDIMQYIKTHRNVLSVYACYFFRKFANVPIGTSGPIPRVLTFDIVVPLMSCSLDVLMWKISVHRGDDTYRFIVQDTVASVKNVRDFLLSFTAQFVSGMKYIHSMRVIHCDLKPENIMCTFYNTGALDVRIGDFGLSNMHRDGTITIQDDYPNTKMRLIGNLVYSPPEVIWRRFISTVYGTARVSGSALSAVPGRQLRNIYLPLVQQFNTFTYTPAIDVWAMGGILLWLYDYCLNILRNTYSMINGAKDYEDLDLYYASNGEFNENNMVPYLRETFNNMLSTWTRDELTLSPYYSKVQTACATFAMDANLKRTEELLRTKITVDSDHVKRENLILGEYHARFMGLVKSTQAIDTRLRVAAQSINFVYAPNAHVVDDDDDDDKK